MKAEFGRRGGDRAGPVGFNHEPPTAVTEALKRTLAPVFPRVMEPPVRLRALEPVADPVGRYQLVTGNESWFVRVSRRWRDPVLERALTSHLVSRAVSINPLLVAGAPLPWGTERLRVDVRPMIFGRDFDGSAADLDSLASTLAACHRALRDWSGSDAVRAASCARAERLAAVRDRIASALKNDAFDEFVDSRSWTAEHSLWAKKHRDWLAAMTEHFDPHLDQRARAQCLHGQIHRGNVLFRSDNGAAVLLDFEESVHVFAPVAWDVAHLVQRFCLRDDNGRDVPIPLARERYSIVSKAYGASVPGLAEMIRQAAWLSIAAILERHLSEDTETEVREYDKFVDLEGQTQTYENLL